MAVLVGIDEAGFGPILGPLVVSSSTFLLPKSLVEKDLWQELKSSVAERRRGMGGRILISDSKKAYSKSIGIKHLERTVLTFLKYLGKQPAELTELMEILCPESLDRRSGAVQCSERKQRPYGHISRTRLDASCGPRLQVDQL